MATVSEISVKPDHNSLGKASFIIGLIGLIMSFVPILGFVSWLLAPLAILFGLIALRRMPRSLAIVGVVTGAIALFVCVSWVKGTKVVGQAMSADTFNNGGAIVDNSHAPLMAASVRQIWKDLDDNKIAAGKKYAGHRLQFTDEKIAEFTGKADSPSINFVGKEGAYIEQYVSASFSAKDGERIGALKKGQRIAFVCVGIGESFGEGYSLSDCTLS